MLTLGARDVVKLRNQLLNCTTLYKQTDKNQFSRNVYTHSTAALLPMWKQLLLSGWPGARGPERGQLTP